MRVLVLPETQLAFITRADKEAGILRRDITQLSPEALKYPGVFASYKSFLLASDARYPVYKVTAAATASTFYVQPGDVDARPIIPYSGTDKNWSVGYILGAGALIDWTAKPLHFENNITEYQKKKGIGAFTERGIQTALIANDTGVIENRSSAVVLFANNSVYNRI
jgi:hypothetical protein